MADVFRLLLELQHLALFFLSMVSSFHAHVLFWSLSILSLGRLHTKNRGPLSLDDFATKFPFTTFTFDARGMGESEGETSYDNVEVGSLRFGGGVSVSDSVQLVARSRGSVLHSRSH